ATRPASILAPSALVATGPSVPRAAAAIRVVVDLPLVPVTTTVRRPAPSWRKIDRSSVIATRPPIIAPAPRPVTRDAHRALAPAARASRPRAVITRESLRAIASSALSRAQRVALIEVRAIASSALSRAQRVALINSAARHEAQR